MQLVILLGPSVLMGVAIFVAPRLRSTLRVSARRKAIAGLALLCAVGLLTILATPDYTVAAFTRSVQSLWLIPLLIGIAGFLIQSSLRDPPGFCWWRIAVGFVLLVLACFSLSAMSSLGQLAPVMALLVALATTGVAIVTALWMIWSLPRWRKLIAVLVGVLFPAMLFASIWIGDTQSPEENTQRNGNVIVQALEQCYAETGTYPAKLIELVPTYLTEVPEALTTQGTGWLYTATASQYTLGYWHYPRKFGVTLCLHSSESEGWQCNHTYRYQDWEPFSPVPTPVLRSRNTRQLDTQITRAANNALHPTALRARKSAVKPAL